MELILALGEDCRSPVWERRDSSSPQEFNVAERLPC